MPSISFSNATHIDASIPNQIGQLSLHLGIVTCCIFKISKLSSLSRVYLIDMNLVPIKPARDKLVNKG